MKRAITLLALAILLIARASFAQGLAVRTEKASGQKVSFVAGSGTVNADTVLSVAFVDFLSIYQTDASDVVLVIMKNGATADTLVKNTQPATLLSTQAYIPIGVKVSTSDSLIVSRSANTTGLILVYRTGY